jgi:prepilin-type N-terminal cleavage/methylation domain-containing protein
MSPTRSAGSGGRAGFSLLEVVIATSILTVGAIVVFPTLFAYMEWSRMAHEDNLALHDLEAAAERLRGMPVSQILSYYPPPGSATTRESPRRTVFVVRLTEYDGLHLPNQQMDLEYYAPTADPLVYSLRVTWSDFLRRSRERIFTTAIAR